MADFDMDFAGLKENRFAHLLKPIRDLQENFSIDLAKELEEYLDQLENAQFSFEGAKHQLVDFAEAALLIQGSACVISKKVEFLYMLVYQVLEEMKGRKRQQALGPDDQPQDGNAGPAQAAARNRGGAVAHVDDDDDNLQRFWCDEPYLKEAEDLDLPADGPCAQSTSSVIRAPATLLALEEHGTSATTAGSKGDGDAGIYRLQQCLVHSSGALMLDPRDLDLYDQNLRYVGPQHAQDDSLQQLIASQQLQQQPEYMHQQVVVAAAQPPAAVAKAAQNVPEDAGAAAMDVDPGPANDLNNAYDDDGGGGFAGGDDWPSDDEGAMAAGTAAGGEDAGGAAAAGAAPSEAEGNGAAGEGEHRARVVRSRGAASSIGVAVASDGEEGEQPPDPEEEFDPYKPLDPFAKGRLPIRPFVACRARKSHKRRAPAASGNRANAPDGGLLLPEFNYYLESLRRTKPTALAKQEHARKLAQKAAHASIRLMGLHTPGPVFTAADAAAAVAADLEDAEDPEADEGGQHNPGYDDGDGGGGVFGGGGGASDLDDDILPGIGLDGLPGPQDDSWHGDDVAGDEGGRGRGDWEGMVPPMGRLDDVAEDGEQLSYEELCRAHMESMFKAAQAREVQSDLARRVSSWRQRIGPVLQAEESLPAFDIQDYGQRLLSRLAALKVTDEAPQGEQQQPAPKAASPGEQQTVHIAGSVVFAGLQKYEVPRMFSAMLQLVNNRNVAIFKTDNFEVAPGEVPQEPFRLELISTDMYHKTMGDRLAAPQQQADGAGSPDDGDGYRGNDEDRDTQRPKAKKQGAGGRGKASGAGGAKRAKKARVRRSESDMSD